MRLLRIWKTTSVKKMLNTPRHISRGDCWAGFLVKYPETRMNNGMWKE